MKIRKVCLILILSLGMSTFIAVAAQAQVKTCYRSSSPTVIYTSMNAVTTITFPAELQSVVSPAMGFGLEFVKKGDSITITTKKPGAKTNLNVFTNDGLEYTFRIYENGDEFYDIVHMLPAPEINYRDIINLVSKKLVEIDPALQELLEVYDVKEYSFQVPGTALKVYFKRAVLVKSIDKMAIWLRLENTNSASESNESRDRKGKVKTVTSSDLKIPVNLIQFKDQLLFAACIEDQKEVLQPGEFTDVYLILDGALPYTSYALTMNINGKDESFTLSNIPYVKQVFKVFIANDKTYETVMVDDYRR
jgi:hypothetical protein